MDETNEGTKATENVVIGEQGVPAESAPETPIAEIGL